MCTEISNYAILNAVISIYFYILDKSHDIKHLIKDLGIIYDREYGKIKTARHITHYTPVNIIHYTV